MKHLRKIFVFFVVTLFFSCNTKVITKTAQIKPNVLLLYMDDLRPELATYGKTHIISPNIDKLASKGVKFTNAYCNVPVCGASRASMLTGMLPTKNRFIDYKTYIQEETPNAITLPQLFKNNGYVTISNGKINHHLDDKVTDWDQMWRPYAFDKNNLGLSPTAYWNSIWKDYQNPENIVAYKATGNGPAFENADVADSVYVDGLVTQRMIRDLKMLKKLNKPFFLAGGFISTHLPFKAPKKYWDLYHSNQIKQPENYNYIPKDAPLLSIGNSGELRYYTGIPKEGQVPDSTAINLIHGYYAAVTYVDALIGQILTELKVQKLDKNTIIVLVADHGFNLQEHTQWGKYLNYNSSTQVPLIIYNPFTNDSGSRNALVQLVDVYPTLAELCGLKLPKNQLEGISLIPVIKNKKLKGNDHILIKRGSGFTLKTMDYSYTEYIDRKDNSIMSSMLYDHRIDKNENENVVNVPKYADVVTILHKTLHTAYKENIEGN